MAVARISMGPMTLATALRAESLFGTKPVYWKSGTEGGTPAFCCVTSGFPSSETRAKIGRRSLISSCMYFGPGLVTGRFFTCAAVGHPRG
ncbi:hypothetical protein F5Y13DRAFT_172293 [Hypoxylon sp. FL1857]|nr:hypothetical protein F5Y13DRAFT_172293 [Hypoxylon sp. FL1857]